VTSSQQPSAAPTGDVLARALCVGERIDIREMAGERISPSALLVPVGNEGRAVLFRYGCVVLFGVSAADERAFLDALAERVADPLPQPETEELLLRPNPERGEGLEGEVCSVASLEPARLLVVADVLSDSVALARYEARVADAFNEIEPVARELQRTGRAPTAARDLMRHIGTSLLMEQRMVGRIEVGEKPEVLWDRPDLERLYLKLLEEYELRERQRALERKLGVVGRTAETFLELLQAKRSLRVEWYILAVIVIEILLLAYWEM
jgi:uncharacterized Rmd1/YagE family protein